MGTIEQDLSGMGFEGELATSGTRDPAPEGDLPRTRGGSGQNMWREAAMVALPLVHHSTMAFHFHGSPDFLHKHSQL